MSRSELKAHQREQQPREMLPHIATLAITLVLVACPQAWADSAYLAPQHWSNELNVGLIAPAQRADDEGYSLFNSASYSPSGLLYPLLYEPARQEGAEHESAAQAVQPESSLFTLLDTSRWQWSGALEFGYLFTAGTTDTDTFREYGDWDEAPILNRIVAQAYHGGTGEYFSLNGGGLGRDDQYLSLNYGRQGRFDVLAWYDRTPHTFSTNARVLWDGAGSGYLRLPQGLTPGASRVESVRAALAERGESTLKLERDRVGLAFTAKPGLRWEVFVNGATEWRDGARPFGGTFNYPTFGQVTETVEPINYITHAVDLGLRYLGQDLQANLSYKGSFFFNDTATLIWENPGLSPFPVDFIPERGRFALAPDNRFHQWQADVAAQLPWLNARWTSSLAYNRKAQDEALLPPTISTGIGNNTRVPIDFDQYNTVDALSRRNADALIETYFLQSEISLQPARRWRSSAEFRFVGENNHTDYTAFNPLTGRYGYISEDGGNLVDDGLFTPGQRGDFTRIRNAPYEKDERQLTLSTDYRLTRRGKLGLNYVHLEKDYAYREREDVQDDRSRLFFNHRGWFWSSLRAALEYGRRSGDEYILNPLAPLTSVGLPGYVPAFPEGQAAQELAQLRVFDLSSRDQYAADLQLRFNPSLGSDLGLNLRYERDDYSAQYGLTDAHRFSAGAEWNQQFSKNSQGYIYYSYQDHGREAAGINDAGANDAGGNAGGPSFPLSNAWQQSLNESNHALGLGWTKQWREFLFELDYSLGYARSRLNYDFNSPGALAFPVTPGETRADLPLQTFEQHLFRASVRYPVNQYLATRLFYRLEAINIDDYHYRGLDDPVVQEQIFLATVPEDFTAHVVGVFFELSL